MQQAEDIQAVLAQLDAIIHQAIREDGAAWGIFPALYRRVTQAVSDGIEAGDFEDSARMDRLDTVFANRYLLAFEEWRAGGVPTRVWARAFHASVATRHKPMLHLMLGMNAHIVLDLGLATATTAREYGQDIDELKGDFLEINRLLFSMVDDVQDILAKAQPELGLIDRWGRRMDEWAARRILGFARAYAWKLACKAHKAQPEELPALTIKADRKAHRISRMMLRHPFVKISRLLRSLVPHAAEGTSDLLKKLQS